MPIKKTAKKETSKDNIEMEMEIKPIKVKAGKGFVSVMSGRFSIGATIATRPYESAKLDVSFTIQPLGAVTLEEFCETGWDLVMSEIGPKIKEIREKSEKAQQAKNNG